MEINFIYFHRLVKNKQAYQGIINNIHKDQTLDNSEDINHLFLSYYKNLFPANSTNIINNNVIR